MKSQAVRTTMQLARLLNGQRKEKGLSQKKAAAKVGMVPKTISALENHPEGKQH
ncbi:MULTISPECIES: helix-turn-helix domain-containing protein [Prosthecochloris]|uniref:helix-turn-helix domain-containing protein n=1 Tax=Prosthecochloris TaxID=1101 RepID=UPI001959A026|nr:MULTISPECIES: helix-turn-helix domain-containing protein [Prosthecochloris]